jgi:outer membrane protein assembly factor BamB
MLLGGAAVDRGTVVAMELGQAGRHDQALALVAPDGHERWRADLGAPRSSPPWIGRLRDRVYVAHAETVFALEAATGKLLRTYPIASGHAATWNDRVLVLVEARGTRSDSDYGDAGVHAIDGATGEVILRDDLGRDVPGGQQASDPVVLGDLVVAIARGQVRAYRLHP